TTKRAYEELEKEGFIYTLPAKGCYVAPKNMELLREENLKKIEEHIEEIIKLAAACNLCGEEIIEMVKFGLEDEG
ncbi:MAG: GntR family transcriptional regulator, partial [Clostridia bacterium]|nr:GntR family transcriptional regulator [Clostridia bacterium]